jgi:hypothetical protein
MSVHLSLGLTSNALVSTRIFSRLGQGLDRRIEGEEEASGDEVLGSARGDEVGLGTTIQQHTVDVKGLEDLESHDDSA